MLVLQIVQTRILSVITWYYLAFFAISVAMLGMTIGAIWVYHAAQVVPSGPACERSVWYALATAVAIPASMMAQFSLITTTTSLTASTLVSLVSADVGDGGPLRLFRHRGQSGAHAKPLPGEPGLWRGSARRCDGLRRGGAAAERAGWPHHLNRRRTGRGAARIASPPVQVARTGASWRCAVGGRDLRR